MQWGFTNPVILSYVFDFVILECQLPKCTKTRVKSHKIAYKMPQTFCAGTPPQTSPGELVGWVCECDKPLAYSTPSTVASRRMCRSHKRKKTIFWIAIRHCMQARHDDATANKNKSLMLHKTWQGFVENCDETACTSKRCWRYI